MFEKTFSFWRRLVGGGSATATAVADPAAQDERRLWARYPADLEGNVHIADLMEDRIRANVRDLSVGGANLIVDRPLEAGQMLSLELPGDKDEVRTVLACIVRVNPEQNGNWSLGCVFARELAEDDLQRFGARKEIAEHNDQRTWVRFHCALNASYRKVGDPNGQPQPATILNISANGIGLSVKPALQAGTLLNVDLVDKSGRLVRTILACIVHTTRRSAEDFAIGCNFIRELSEDELHAIL